MNIEPPAIPHDLLFKRGTVSIVLENEWKEIPSRLKQNKCDVQPYSIHPCVLFVQKECCKLVIAIIASESDYHLLPNMFEQTVRK